MRMCVRFSAGDFCMPVRSVFWLHSTILLPRRTANVPRSLGAAMHENRGSALVQGLGGHEVLAPDPQNEQKQVNGLVEAKLGAGAGHAAGRGCL